MKRMPVEGLETLRPLCEDFPGLHGALLGAALEDAHGEVFVDDPDTPNVVRVIIGDFHCIAGDPDAPGAREALLAIPQADYLAVPDSWHKKVRATLDTYPYDRFAFSAPEQWDRAHLASIRDSLPVGFALLRVDESSVAAFKALNETFVSNFRSTADFLARGVGFAIADDASGQIVAGCSSYTISKHCLEFEIETRRDHQRRGLALITGARMIEHCLDHDLGPYWDAAHEGSALLAERLGFVKRRKYTAYRVGTPPYKPES